MPGVRNEGEDFGRDPVGQGKPVRRRPNDVEGLESVPLEPIDLKHVTNQQPFAR